MDNLGAFITLNGKDMKPNFTTYEAVVLYTQNNVIYKYSFYFVFLQPHPNVKPMAYASSLMSLIG